MKQDIMSVMFDNVTMSEAINYALQCINSNKKCMVVTPNAEIAYNAKKNNRLKNIINHAGLVLPDGIGVILAGKIIKKPLKEKVAGVEFGESIIAKSNAPIFFLGGKPGVAQTAKEKLEEKYPSCNIVGVCDGYFDNKEHVIEQINQSGAKVVFVCLGSPKQEYFIEENMDKINATLFMGLGGSLDVYAGVAQRAPKFFVNFGLEWLYRLIKQPSRIIRMKALPLYVIDSIMYRLKGAK